MSDVPFLESCFFIEGIFYIDEDELPDGYTISDLQNEIKEAAPPSVRIRGFEWLHKIHNLYFRNPSAFYGDSLGNRVSTAFHASSMESFMKSRYNFPPYETESLEEFTSPTVRSMNETTLSNLKIRLGLRYYYCHLRQICEHYLYFSDIRLFNTTTDYQVIPSTDPSSRRVQHLSLSDTYPRLTYMAKFTRKKCDVCLLWSAQYIVYGDRLTINNPTLFCQHCYHMLHYTHEGELLYDDYSVFPYLHDMK